MEIYFLEHTHIFLECQGLYKEMAAFNEYQNKWYKRKLEQARPIEEYLSFIEYVKTMQFPVKMKLGLEVCYSPEHEDDIEEIRRQYPFDFLVGSIHFLDGWAFSHLKQRWNREDYDVIL